MIPLRDVIPSRSTPIVTTAIIVVNAMVFLFQLSLGKAEGDGFIRTYGLVPAHFAWPNVITSMFLPGGLMHVGGNMLYLWIFGDNVEDTLGHGRFLIFYLVSGVIAALAQVALNVDSSIPMIGASGAVSGVLGAYLLLFPRANVLTLIIVGFFVRLIRIPAVLVLGFWFLIQFVSGLVAWTARTEGGEVAWFAHLGGFLAGMALVLLLRPRKPAAESHQRFR